MSLFSCQIAKTARHDLETEGTIAPCHGDCPHQSLSPSPHTPGHLPKIPEDQLPHYPGNRHSQHVYGHGKMSDNDLYFKIHGKHAQPPKKSTHRQWCGTAAKERDPLVRLKELQDARDDVMKQMQEWLHTAEGQQKGEKQLESKEWAEHRRKATEWMHFLQELSANCEDGIRDSVSTQTQTSKQKLHDEQTKMRDSHLMKLPKLPERQGNGKVQQLEERVHQLQEQLHRQRLHSDDSLKRSKELSAAIIRHEQIHRKCMFKHKQLLRIIKSLIHESEEFLQKVLADVTNGVSMQDYPQLVRNNMKHLREYKDLDLELRF